MGIYKFLNLQMIHWCFQLMGNHISCVQLQPEPSPPPPSAAADDDAGTVKLIHSDGLVETYHRPVRASELMAQFPKHLVCRSDSFYICQKIPALSEHDLLQLGHKYFLLPQQFFQSVLTFVTIASFVASQKAQGPSPVPVPQDLNSCRNAFLRKAAGCQPFDIQRTPSGCLRIRVSDEFISQLMEQGRRVEKEASRDSGGDGEQKPISRLCTTPQLERDYSQLVVLSRRWEPKLEMIRESDKSRSSSSFGMKRRKKPPSPPSTVSAPNHKIQKSSESHVHAAAAAAAATAASTKPSYRAKIKIRSRK